MLIRTPLELYDLLILQQIQNKHPGVTNAHFLFAPPERDSGFRLAAEKWDKTLFPIFFVFRDEPAIISDQDTSAAKYLVKFNIGDGQSTSVINCWLKYQVDFYSNSMFDLNMMNTEYFKFMKSRFVEMDFNQYGIDWVNKFEIIFDGIEGMNSIEEMYSIGRYFRYTYRIRMLAPLFDVNAEVTAEHLKLSLYGNTQLLETITKDL